MKKVSLKSEGLNYTAIELGKFNNLDGYSYLHPKLLQEIKGKVFIGEALKSTGVEVSFQTLPAKAVIPFLHAHKNHEEVYVVIKGEGKFQVDDEAFKIKEGSVIRIAPEGRRTFSNTQNSSMIIMVIQSQENSNNSFYVSDGFKAEGVIL